MNSFHRMCQLATIQGWCWRMPCTTCANMDFRHAIYVMSQGESFETWDAEVHRRLLGGKVGTIVSLKNEESKLVTDILIETELSKIRKDYHHIVESSEYKQLGSENWLGYLGVVLARIRYSPHQIHHERVALEWRRQLNRMTNTNYKEGEPVKWTELEHYEYLFMNLRANTAVISATTSTYAGGQIIGKREEQQDTFAIHDEAKAKGLDTSHLLLVIADGMGGHVGGATASSLAVKAFVDAYQQNDETVMTRLFSGLDAANRAIADGVEETPALSGMGCTLVGVVVTEAGVEWISVGDSPLWLLETDGLNRLNADHSMKTALDKMVELGTLTAEEAATDHRRHMLRSAVMGSTIELVDKSLFPVPIAGNRLILATDGLETLSLDEIASIAEDATHRAPDACVNALLSAVSAKAEPRQDNVTVIAYWDNTEEVHDHAETRNT